ncbi:MAG: type II secretion system protein [bacterium]|nr:type II secretion system protein [bacterium]
MRKQSGFTLIELLVVIAIIGLLSTLAVVALNNARAKSRDAKRVSDIKQVQTALELYYNDQNKYPVDSAVVLGAGDQACLDTEGWDVTACAGATKYMAQVPKNPLPGGADYSYTSADGTTYSINFTLEGKVGELDGASTANPNGVQ